jgi:type II secretory pathway pseudopilin PulG
MTLIELLVSITILAMMILAFSTILVQSQRLVSVAQSTRRSYALSSSIARIIRSDVRRASQNGFLAITTGQDGTPRLILTAAGVAHSLLSDAKGTGAFICYGLGDNAADAERKVLWRPAYVLNRFATPPSVSTDGDRLNLDLADLQNLAKADDPNNPGGLTMDSVVDKIAGFDPSLRVPPESLGDINELWQVLATDVKDNSLSITWTDGTADGYNNLNWYGIDPQHRDGPILRSGKTDIEIDTTGGYRALWTHHDQTNWPRAIKIRFTTVDRNMPREFRGTDGQGGLDFEVICNLGQ